MCTNILCTCMHVHTIMYMYIQGSAQTDLSDGYPGARQQPAYNQNAFGVAFLAFTQL